MQVTGMVSIALTLFLMEIMLSLLTHTSTFSIAYDPNALDLKTLSSAALEYSQDLSVVYGGWSYTPAMGCRKYIKGGSKGSIWDRSQ
ncbi:transmembrane protein, putative [Medicago truncatula]|uniref:Transmembrane protein, putative n=1 Tax=Medicago truncatula TaxID=3880 RepID=A0A072VQH0_MEDTR|nr:transmembrane protein, putative [Medicago truncatula]